MGQRPTIKHVTTCNLTTADVDHSQEIADAMCVAGYTDFPTRSGAIRFALKVTAGHLRQTGRLPAGLVG
jgi:hypothetical protein